MCTNFLLLFTGMEIVHLFTAIQSLRLHMKELEGDLEIDHCAK